MATASRLPDRLRARWLEALLRHAEQRPAPISTASRADGNGEAKIAHLSDQIARDWKLSPDGATLAYSVGGERRHAAVITKTLDLTTGVASERRRGDRPTRRRAEFNPAWNGNGELTIASLKLDGGGDALAVTRRATPQPLTTNDDSIDLPLEWSPDGATLAVRSVEGKTPLDAATSHVDLVARRRSATASRTAPTC